MMERITCPVCCGDGQLEYEINRPQSFTRDVGYIDTVWDECLECHGEGEVEIAGHEKGGVRNVVRTLWT